jgi:hypothetical protein
VRISGAYLPDDLTATEAGIRRALEQLRLPPSAARLWLSSAAGRLDQPAEWLLDYDPDLELATFEVLLDSRLVFGIDDLLPQGRSTAQVD